jgi:hypothetical protein
MNLTNGSTSTLSSTAVVTAAEWFAFQNLPESEKQPWLDWKWQQLLCRPIEPDVIDDFTPDALDLDENLGPCLVEITDYIGWGDESEEATWTVEASVNSPQIRLVF